jgi:thymidylate synthase
MSKINDEYQYLYLIQNILENGTDEVGRNGTTRMIFGNMMRFSLKNNVIPILTTKQTAWKTCLKELFWFIKGDTNNNHLKEQGVHIWNANADDFKRKNEYTDDNCKNDKYADGLLGPIYGFQWRHFNAEYNRETGEPLTKGVDQLADIITTLKNPLERNSRRLIMTAWNPCAIDSMALPPCHILCQFQITNGNELSCALYQRSGDVGLGVPFNIASYSFLTHMLAHHCGLVAKEFVYFLGNAHIYENHLTALQIQMERTPYELPTIRIKGDPKERIEDYSMEDIEINGYKYHPKIEMQMSV